MATSIVTTITTDESRKENLEFEWVGTRSVSVVRAEFDDNDNPIVDSFQFKEIPTREQVVKACEEYFK